jgi:hypothetical protein
VVEAVGAADGADGADGDVPGGVAPGAGVPLTVEVAVGLGEVVVGLGDVRVGAEGVAGVAVGPPGVEPPGRPVPSTGTGRTSK